CSRSSRARSVSPGPLRVRSIRPHNMWVYASANFISPRVLSSAACSKYDSASSKRSSSLATMWLERGEHTDLIRSARRGSPTQRGRNTMVLIGIDPHKATHTAVAVDKEETALGELTVKADRHQVECLLKWAIEYPDRRWAIESANGLGFLLAQQLVAAGEDVVDVPPTLAARVRVLGSGKSQKNDPNDALSTAIAALRAKRLRTVVTEDHGAILRLLVDHHHDLGSLRTQAICRIHALLRCLVPGGTRIRLSADGAAAVLRTVRTTNAA